MRFAISGGKAIQWLMRVNGEEWGAMPMCKAEDLSHYFYEMVHYFNEDGLGAIVNSSRGIIAAYKQEQYAKFGPEHFAEAARAATEAMIADIDGALQGAKG